MISSHFARSEFSCKCKCGRDTVDAELVTVLEAVREHFSAPVYVTSGNRCERYNKSVGGSEYSQHLLGRAADIRMDHFTPPAVYRFLDETYPTKYGLGKYDSFTHIDTRVTKARW